MYHFYSKSCEQMDEVADGSVSLVVTSPPYWNAIDYEQHVADSEAWYRTRRGGLYEEYLDWLSVCFTEVFKKQKPGGFCAVVIGTVLHNGRQYPVPQRFTTLMEEIGYHFHQEIVWHKVTGGVKRAGVTIQKPYPGYYHPNIMSESILVFQRPGPKIYEKRSQAEKEKNRVNIDGIFTREIANDVWHIAPVPPNYLPHPCPFPEEIPYRLILLYSYEEDIVLDPFAGIGTTAKVAWALRRQFIGYEIQQQYVEFALKRISEPLHLRDQLIAKFEKWPVLDPQYQQARHSEESFQTEIPGFNMLHEPSTALHSESDRLVYQTLRKSASWLVKRGLKMIVSPDLDGFLSAHLLGAILGWEVVGFYDVHRSKREQKSILWIQSEYISQIESGKVVFIDHDIYRRRIPSLGHHMLSLDETVPIPEHADPNSMSVNPNLLRGFTLAGAFDRKYPFGTVHFLLACYTAWDVTSGYRPSRQFLPLLLHVDSSLQTAFTASYRANALDWLEWLGGADDQNSPLYEFCQMINRTSLRRVLELDQMRAEKFKKLGLGRTSQCHLADPTDQEKWKRFMDLTEWISELSGWRIEWPKFPQLDIVKVEMSSKRVQATDENFRQAIAEHPFSYALTSKTSEDGLSFSILPQEYRDIWS